MNVLTVREYEPRDRKMVEQCIIALQDHEAQLEPDRVPGYKIASKYLQVVLEQCALYRGKLFVATCGQAVVGFVCVWHDRLEELATSIHDYAYISDYVVLDTYRRQGIGAALLHQAEAYARALGLDTMRLNVLARNQLARDVYAGLGFQEYELTGTKHL